MDGRLVIARAFDGEPLKRVVVDTGPRVVYIANPEFMDRVVSGESSAVGFPLEDVYVFDEKQFYDLAALQSQEQPGLGWNRLQRFSPDEG